MFLPSGEVETVADIFTLQYILVAELEDQTRTGKDCQPQPTDPKDERLKANPRSIATGFRTQAV